ncbi:hypothetical protein [Haloarcula regularis]|uniref:hypothetical protein n=1 Tax=Haloarcula regularis TaxID=3033392 RepID=UPI0023E797C1|nr:hypothetical protein [Halomicroarcula sp. SYNS111]
MIAFATGPAMGAITLTPVSDDQRESAELRPSIGAGDGVLPAAQVEFETRGSGAVQNVVVVERVDRDGDGYASGFRLKIVSDTRPKDPKENSQAGRSTAKLFSVLIGGPFKKLHDFFTKDASDEFFTRTGGASGYNRRDPRYLDVPACRTETVPWPRRGSRRDATVRRNRT